LAKDASVGSTLSLSVDASAASPPTATGHEAHTDATPDQPRR